MYPIRSSHTSNSSWFVKPVADYSQHDLVRKRATTSDDRQYVRLTCFLQLNMKSNQSRPVNRGTQATYASLSGSGMLASTLLTSAGAKPV